jgi:hypothetical protein
MMQYVILVIIFLLHLSTIAMQHIEINIDDMDFCNIEMRNSPVNQRKFLVAHMKNNNVINCETIRAIKWVLIARMNLKKEHFAMLRSDELAERLHNRLKQSNIYLRAADGCYYSCASAIQLLGEKYDKVLGAELRDLFEEIIADGSWSELEWRRAHWDHHKWGEFKPEASFDLPDLKNGKYGRTELSLHTLDHN